jgi:hypothetical protein
MTQKENPTTVATVVGAKPNNSKAILQHAVHALHAIFFSVNPAIYSGLMAYIVWGVRHGF